ncbi:type VII secretion protein EccB [Kutzneria sp. CA-103260]|uniref:type VII secretion protein EccB n=1 Tax=Kutzneria sp. CA-103260 TaxID=2802641 RepID=UPI001BA9E122|nr:type VII secretion protein EccB [Kutzneria sp. CA-103260]QUQ70667.1 ESX-1 secretion system ATPase EccB1 [Kutzneria sp. CA-103260]
MPSTPTSKSQVQAYRFMLKRMESALVRKDSVMMHDPMGSHMRSAVVGVLLAMVAAIGFVLFAVLSPAGSVPESNGVVIGKQSGAVYALINDANNKPRLVPTFNVTSARLILLANSSGGGGASAQGGSSPAAAAPSVVDDDALQGLPRDKKQGIVDGPQLLPVGPQRVSNDWAVCDTLPDNATATSGTPTTTVLGGVPNIGNEIDSSDQFLVTPNAGKDYYLIFRKSQYSHNPELKNSAVVKAKVDMSSSAAGTYQLRKQDARPISSAVLNAIPGTIDMTAPDIIGHGQTPSYSVPAGAKIGEILRTKQLDGSTQSYVLTATGKHLVSPQAAQAVEDVHGSPKHDVGSNDVVGIPDDTSYLPVDDYPTQVASGTPLSSADYPSMCAVWSYPNNAPSLTVRITQNHQPVVPAGKAPMKLSNPSTAGQLVSNFYLPTGQAAVVRDSTSSADAAAGPIYIISDLGVKYGFASSLTGMTPDQVAAGIGLGDPTSYPPAPDAIIRLLPQGTALDPAAALRTYDTMQPPATAGNYPNSLPGQQQQTGGN